MAYFAAHGIDKILLVEDDPAVRETLHRLLCGAGYAVLATDDPDHACALLDNKIVNKIVHAMGLDFRFPKNRSGLHVLEFARAHY